MFNWSLCTTAIPDREDAKQNLLDSFCSITRRGAGGGGGDPIHTRIYCMQKYRKKVETVNRWILFMKIHNIT